MKAYVSDRRSRTMLVGPAVAPLPSDDDSGLEESLPASYCQQTDGLDNIHLPQADIQAFLEQELSLKRLEAMHEYLWLVGLPRPPRPLHQQLVLGRDIIVTEKLDMHLVWETGRIFVKPLPRYLLNPNFWKTHLHCPGHTICDCLEKEDTDSSDGGCRRDLRKRATGFIFTYAAP